MDTPRLPLLLVLAARWRRGLALLLLLAAGAAQAAPGLVARFFNNTTLSGTPVLTRVDATVNYDWASAP